MYEKQYTIETVFKSHSEWCTAYLQIDVRTGPFTTIQKSYI